VIATSEIFSLRSRAGDGEQRQHAEADHRGTDRDLAALLAAHACGHREKQRRQPRRVYRHQDGHEGIEKTVEIRH
jgi:hypothetical protein